LGSRPTLRPRYRSRYNISAAENHAALGEMRSLDTILGRYPRACQSRPVRRCRCMSGTDSTFHKAL
jgi:hypothetical protein